METQDCHSIPQHLRLPRQSGSLIELLLSLPLVTKTKWILPQRTLSRISRQDVTPRSWAFLQGEVDAPGAGRAEREESPQGTGPCEESHDARTNTATSRGTGSGDDEQAGPPKPGC